MRTTTINKLVSYFAAFVLAITPVIVHAQASILPNARTQFIDANGNPLVGGTVTFYVPSTTTPKTTWQDAAEGTPNANPLTLDSLGTALIWGAGTYREIVKDSLGNVIWDAVTAPATGSSGGGGVTSFNTRTGAVNLLSADVTGALGFTPLRSSNILAGSGITVTPAGGNVTIAATGGGGGTGAGTLTNIAALRALTSITPSTNIVLGYTTAGKGGGTFVYNPADTTTADNGCTVFVDASSHRWYRTYSGAINVQWCGAQGDGSTDDKTAIQAALAIGPATYIAPSPTCYLTSGSLTLAGTATTGAAIFGDTPTTSCIKATTAAVPIIVVPAHSDATDQNITVANLTLNRSIAATAGGDGIQFTSYVNYSTLKNLVVENQYNGLNLMSTDTSYITDVLVGFNYNIGVLMTSSNWYPTMQWYLQNVFSINNESDGFRATTVTNSYGTPCASLGTWTDLATFANNGYGANLIGISSTYCLQGVRIVGGFFGGDANDEIRLDTYNTGSGPNVVTPTYAEGAGGTATGRTSSHAASNLGAGIYLSANTGPTQVSCGICNNNSFDGLTSFASSLQVTGGTYTNNGHSAAAAGLTRANGVNIAGGNARGTSIASITAGNTAGSVSQVFGVAAAVDYVSVSGANLLNNFSAYGTGLGTANSIVAGVLPVAANTSGGGGSYCSLTGCTMSGPLVVNSTLSTSGLATLASLSVTGAMSINSGMTIVGSTGITGTSAGIEMLNVVADASLGVGTGASGVVGRINAANVVSSGAISGTTGTFSGAVSMTGLTATTGNFSSTISGTTITASSDLIASNTLHVTNASALHGTTISSGGLAVTGGITADNEAISVSLGVGTGASGVTGYLNVTNSVNLNSTPYTNP